MTVTHVGLIRGINVGGKRPVPMAGLRAALEAQGYDDVRTYIQSGNVLLAAPGVGAATVAGVVERVLAAEFGCETVVVTMTAVALRRAITGAPVGFGNEPDIYHSDVVFLRPGLEAKEALSAFGIREGVDTVWAGEGVVYFRRLSAERTKSRMSSVLGSPHYKYMTIRNWRTTTTLARMLDAT
jgi:uncharacterized protein (DUF1697 family)